MIIRIVMKKTYRLGLILMFSIFIPTTVLHSQNTQKEKLHDLYKTQDVNGFMPEQVYIKTMTQTYCKNYNFVVVDGRIYVKRDGEEKWILFLKKGLPFSEESKRRKSYFKTPEAVREICADADSLFAFDENGVMYNCYINSGTKEKLFVWKKIFGFPKKNPLIQNDLVLNKRGWGMGVRRQDILWYTDIFGNEHHYGTMGLETIYFLTEDGQHIRFTDSGLPPDFSRSIRCPLDGKFVAENISVSGDTIFLIGNDGSMYTRLIDFDTMGCDPMFFKYTYDYSAQKYKGTNYLSNYSEWGLPAEGWKKQEDIPLLGIAKLTKAISIAQNGQGNNARELRVAGTSETGKTGYYFKQLNEKNWSFKPAKLDLSKEIFLDNTKPSELPNEEYAYKGYLSKNDTTLSEYTCSLKNFSLTSEEKSILTITRNKESVSLIVYPIEMWTYVLRYNPGYDGSARSYFLTAEFDSKKFDGLSNDFKNLLDDMFGDKNHKLFAFNAEATNKYFQIDFTGKELRSLSNPLAKPNKYTMFMTTDGAAEIHPDVYKGSLVLTQPLIQEASNSDLLMPEKETYTIRDRSELLKKVEANENYKAKVQTEIDLTKEYEKKTDTSRWGYNAIDLLTTVTFLNKIDFPKIKTMTSYGSELMNTNAESFARLADYKEWCYPHILEIVDLRIKAYSEILEDFDGDEISKKINPRFCNTFPEYFKLVNLPTSVDGFSSSADSKAQLAQITFISYVPGFLLQLQDETNTTVLIELQNSAKLIYSRSSEQKLSDHPFIVPVTFQTVFVPTDNSGEKKTTVAKIENLSSKKGSLVWDGETLSISVKNTPFTSVMLFSGNVK